MSRADGPRDERLLASAAAEAERRRRARRAGVAVGRAGLLAVSLAAWGLASGRLVDAEFLSDPPAVLAALAELVRTGRLWPHLGQTLGEVLLGYGLGVALAVGFTAVVAAVPAAHQVLRPFLVAFYSIPKIALAPLMIMWFGLGLAPKVILATIFVFFVVFLNMVAGVYAVNGQLLNVLRVMSAGRLVLLRKVTLPSAVPHLLTGAVVGEFIAANRGLGYLVTSAAAQFNTAATLAAIVALLGIVVTMDLAVGMAERRLLRWRPPAAAFTGVRA
jgi:NitT/TauT family transport system permease protein